jgi:hypothetical protein
MSSEKLIRKGLLSELDYYYSQSSMGPPQNKFTHHHHHTYTGHSITTISFIVLAIIEIYAKL